MQDSQAVMIDEEGYRANVGIILSNGQGQLLWARRVQQDAWQFPQGGIKAHETPEQALYRELREELGLDPEHVRVLGCTQDWLRYQLPKNMIRHYQTPLCIGQKQIWYMLELIADEGLVRFDRCDKPEFDGWRWVEYWDPLAEVIYFKKEVYEKALAELEPLVEGGSPLSSQS